ncbi:unnamed protein product [Phytomonas sp. Hart1]|nr:unnamed protein product [Phytomonas sp. Hart1]|eukprot:CCW68251.1 unnamed protein product [Phytomonas sp. isolate Hart1]
MRRLITTLVLFGLESSVRGIATRGIPYSPSGTIQDYTSSPRHLSLAEMQYNFDRHLGRKTNGLYDGSTFVPGVGAHPVDRFPFYYPSPNAQQNKAAPPHKALEDLLPELGSGYTADLRTDQAFADLPEHIRAAKQSILMAQSDSSGQVPRGLIPPPPPPDHKAIPKAYQAPRVHLSGLWWLLMCLFICIFSILGRYGV